MYALNSTDFVLYLNKKYKTNITSKSNSIYIYLIFHYKIIILFI